jgi:hypothetical protein
MNARILLTMVEGMMVEAVGPDAYEEMLHGTPQVDRGLAMLALGGEVA